MNTNKDTRIDLYYRQQKMLGRNSSFQRYELRIFAEVLGREGVNRQWVVENGDFYRACTYSANRGIATLRRPSIRLSGRPSVRLSVTLMYRGHIGWTSSKLITRIISLGSFAPRSHNIGNQFQGEHSQNSGGGVGSLFSAENLQHL